MSPPLAPVAVRYATPAGRWVLLGTVLGSAMAMLDGTVVNVALPTIGRQFHAPLSTLQWTVNAYALTLAGFLLLGGSLGDRFGRRRLFVIGVGWFACGSLLCGVAPSSLTLIAARAFQGIGGALLTPASLAIIETSFAVEDRSAAIGAWSGLGGIAAAIGPLLGGWLVTSVSWRMIFLINLPVALVTCAVAIRHIPDTRNEEMRASPIDAIGAALALAGLAAITYALTKAEGGALSAQVAAIGIGGILVLLAFLARENSTAHPLLPLQLFASRQFSGANAVTFALYGALGAALFLLPIELQQGLRFTALQSGAAIVPLTLIMLALSARAGRLAQRVGPRLPMTVGPLLCATGLALLVRIDIASSYAGAVLPGLITFALGLALTVAPLTAAVLAAGSQENAGVSSAINNDVARTAGLLGVAIVPVLAGLGTESYRNPAVFTNGFHTAILVCAALCALGGLIAAVTIRNPAPD